MRTSNWGTPFLWSNLTKLTPLAGLRSSLPQTPKDGQFQMKRREFAAEVLQTLNKQQPGAGHHLCSTPLGKAEYFEGGGLMRNIRESVKRHKMHNSPVSLPPAPITPASLISTITVGILPPAKVLAEDLTKATLREGSPNRQYNTILQAGFFSYMFKYAWL